VRECWFARPEGSPRRVVTFFRQNLVDQGALGTQFPRNFKLLEKRT
jgi:hypothetical protein